jgi:ADP-heptose:LPS heptosyltransferase
MNCLVIRFSSLGDIILTTPVVAALAAQPETTVHYAVAERFRPIVEQFSPQVTIHPFAGHSRENLLSYAGELSTRQFDHIFDLHANWRSRILISRLKANAIHTYPKDFWRRWQMVWLKHGFCSARHVVDRYLTTLHQAGIPAITGLPQLRVNPEAKKAAAAELVRRGWPQGRPMVGIGWGAHWPTKEVPARLWEELFDKLAAERVTPVYLLFAEDPRDPEIADFIAANRRHEIIPFCGMNLPQVLGALSGCSAFVTSDSGLMHAAAALEIPTWGLFGPTHPALGFAPRGVDAHAVHSGIFCSPCSRHGKSACYRRRRYCFEKIDTALLADQIIRRLEKMPHGDQP